MLKKALEMIELTAHEDNALCAFLFYVPARVYCLRNRTLGLEPYRSTLAGTSVFGGHGGRKVKGKGSRVVRNRFFRPFSRAITIIGG